MLDFRKRESMQGKDVQVGLTCMISMKVYKNPGFFQYNGTYMSSKHCLRYLDGHGSFQYLSTAYKSLLKSKYACLTLNDQLRSWQLLNMFSYYVRSVRYRNMIGDR